MSWYSANLDLRKAYRDTIQFGLYSRTHVQDGLKYGLYHRKHVGDRLKFGLFKGKTMHVRTSYKPDSNRGSVLGTG